MIILKVIKKYVLEYVPDFRSLDMPGCEETKSPTSSQETVFVQRFFGPESSLGVSERNIRRKIKC
jgi:hypothetical protein